MNEAERRIASLSPKQRELLMRKMRERGTPPVAPRTPEIPRIPDGPTDRHAPVPPTDFQEALWLSRSGIFDLGGSGANVYLEYEFPGIVWQLAASLNDALRTLIERHEMLRTVVLPDGQLQLLSEVPPYEVEVADLSGRGAERIEERRLQIREEMRYANRPPDRWPLFEIVLHQLDEGRIRLHARFDLILIDGAARGVLLSELVLVLNLPDQPLPELDVSFLDHVRAVAAFRETETYARAHAYWMERLPHLPPPPVLPLARALAPEDVPRVVKRDQEVLGAEDWQTLCGRAARAGITPTTAVSAAFAEVLRSWSAAPDFSVGFGGTYRPPIHPHIERVLGSFTIIHLLAFEDGPGSFIDRARRLQERIAADLDHQEVSGHQVLREYNRLHRVGARSAMPIQLNSVVGYGSNAQAAAAPPASPDAPAPEGGAQPAPRPMIQVDLTEVDLLATLPQVLLFWVVLPNLQGGLSLVSQAVEEVLPGELVPEMIEAYRDLLSRLATLDAAWSEERPAQWGKSRQEALPAGPTPDGAEDLYRRIEEQARTSPEAPALITPKGTLTYREVLDRGPLAALAPDGKPLPAGTGAALLDLVHRLELRPGDRLFSLAPAGSQPALADLLASLAAGAAVVLPAPGEERDPARLAALAAQHRVTVWSSPPALLEAVVTHAEGRRRAAFPPLRLALLHRDAAPSTLAARLGALCPGARLTFTWSSPEIPLAAVAGPFAPSDPAAEAAFEPLAGRRLQVLDASGVPRPAWALGELWAGGPDGPLAYTGERAQLLPDGRIALRGAGTAPPPEALGYGAETRFVESALQRHPALRHALVEWRAGGPRGRLLAWVLPRPGRPPSAKELRRHLRAAGLPAHMVPDSFTFLERLPLTADGAVDRSLLLPPPSAEPAAAPGAWGEVETELAALWEEVLGRRPTTLDDDFFLSGGDSVAAVRLLARVTRRWGRDVDPGELFARPTLAGLSAAVRRGAGLSSRSPLPLPAWARGAGSRLAGLGRRLAAAVPALQTGNLARRTASHGLRMYAILWIGQTVSGMGTALGTFALGVWLFQETKSVTQFSGLMLSSVITGLLLNPVAGSLADRVDRRRVLFLCNLASMAMTLTLATALWQGFMRPEYSYIMAVGMTCIGVLQGPAFVASISTLVPRHLLVRITSMAQTSGMVLAMIAPLLAGFLVGKLSYHGVIFIDACTFLFAALTLLLVRIPQPPASQHSGRDNPFYRDILVGFSYVKARPGLLSLLILFGISNFSIGTVQILLTPLILSFATPEQLGSVNSAALAGLFLGGLVLSIWGGPQRKVWSIFGALVAQALILFLGGLQPNLQLVMGAVFAFMLAGPFVGNSSQAIWQSKVPLDLQGRVFAVRGLIATGALPLAYSIAGPLADHVFEPMLSPGGLLAGTVGRVIGVGDGRGVGFLFILLGALVLTATLASFLNPRLRNVETEIPDAAGPDHEPDSSAPTPGNPSLAIGPQEAMTQPSAR